MLLMLLVNHYAPYAGTVETYIRQQQNIERLRPLFRHLGANSDSSIQVREAARICGMSESHFMSLFKRVTGLSFVTYFNHFRIERAQALLAKTDESMASIGQQVGFCDQSYFGAVFSRIVGMTPATYRRRVRDNTLADQGQPDHMPPRHLETAVRLEMQVANLRVPELPANAQLHKRRGHQGESDT
jgi:AraC-like DNA-binding protein